MKTLFFLFLIAGMTSVSRARIMKDKEIPTIAGEWTDMQTIGHDDFYRAIFYRTGSLVIVKGNQNYDAAYKLETVSQNKISGYIIANNNKARFTAIFEDDKKILFKVKYDSHEQIHELRRTKRFDSNFQLVPGIDPTPVRAQCH
jgi:hypothetical protein